MISNTGYWNLDIQDFHKEHCHDAKLAESIKSIMVQYNINEVYDFGCGEGKYVEYFNSNNIKATGFDGNPNTSVFNSCKVQDLTDINFNEKPLDCVMCLEVGEHVPKEYEDILIHNIDKHINNNGLLILSWALIGQGGLGHVNCQNNDYVIEKINKLGYSYNQNISNILRKSSTLPWFNKTIMVFNKFK